MNSKYLTDRIAAIVLFIFAAWYTWFSSRFTAPIVADSLGPATFPVILGVLMMGLSVIIFCQPDENPNWPTNTLVWVKMAAVIVSFVIYSQIIKPLGFVVATSFEMYALGLLFDAPKVKSLFTSILFSAFLFWLFSSVLKLGLPTGTLLEPFLGG